MNLTILQTERTVNFSIHIRCEFGVFYVAPNNNNSCFNKFSKVKTAVLERKPQKSDNLLGETLGDGGKEKLINRKKLLVEPVSGKREEKKKSTGRLNKTSTEKIPLNDMQQWYIHHHVYEVFRVKYRNLVFV